MRKLIFLIALILGVSFLIEALFRFISPSGSELWVDRPLFQYSLKHRTGADTTHPPQNTFRIAVLGDSYARGANVPPFLAFPAVLEWLLNVGTSLHIEVDNYARDGMNSHEMVQVLQSILEKHPDLILLSLFLDDSETSHDIPPEIMQLQKKIASLSHVQTWLLQHSAFYRFILYRKLARSWYIGQLSYYRRITDPQSQIWQDHLNRLKHMIDMCRDAKIPIISILWPHFGFPLDERYPFDDVHERYRLFFQAHGVPIIDLRAELFYRMNLRRLQAVPLFDPHPDEIAHARVAEVLFTFLKTNMPPIRQRVISPRIHPNPAIPSVRLRLAPGERF